jgi:hypothetical protein
MADQRDERLSEELTPDQCIDFAAGLLDGEQRAEVLRLASVSPQSEELLRSIMAQAETARGAAAANAAQGATEDHRSVRESSTSGLARGFRRFLDSLAGGGRLVPAMAGASLLILGLILGAGAVQLLQTDGAETGAPAQLISLFPSATRTAGPGGTVSAGTGLYIELNGIDHPCETPLLFNLAGPTGRALLQGRLLCQPETGEWAGLFVPDLLLAEPGEYLLQLSPETAVSSTSEGQLEYSFNIR